MNERPDYEATSYGRSDAWNTGHSGREVPMATYPWVSAESWAPRPSYYRVPHEREKGGLLNMIMSNPIPAALAALGLGMLWTNRPRESHHTHRPSGVRHDHERSQTHERTQTHSDWNSPSTSAGSHYGSYGGETSRSGQSRDQGQQVSDQVQGAAGQVVNQAQQVGGQVQDAASQVVGQVQDTASQVVGQVQDVAGQVQHQVKHQAQGIWQMVEANPAVTGALGAVLGGVTALLLPETEKENQLLGETRDRVVSTVQEKAEDTVARVQAVAEEAGSAAMEAGQAAMGELSSEPQGSGSGKNQGSGSGSGSGKNQSGGSKSSST